MKSKLIVTCLLWIISCLIISGFTGWVSASHIKGWYQALNQPTFTPPDWLFAPVWMVLYVMIGGVGGYLWLNRKQYSVLFSLFILQLLFNFLWSFIFFVGQSVSWALLDILALWLSLFLLVLISTKKHKGIALLLVPYFLWVSFAATLNGAILLLN